MKYIESDTVTKREPEHDSEDSQDDQDLPEEKKKKRRRKKRNKKTHEEDEQTKELNLDAVAESPEPTAITQACLSRLSDQEFDKSINEFEQRLMKIERESQQLMGRNQCKLMPNLHEEWL